MKTRSEQINLFEQIEAEEREASSIRTVQEGYRIWLRTLDLTPCTNHAVVDYRYHDGIIHRCDTMPADIYMWQNTVACIHGGEYWVKGGDGILTGTQMDICPYCHANLCRGDGQRFLRKASGHVYSERSYRRYYKLDEVEASE